MALPLAAEAEVPYFTSLKELEKEIGRLDKEMRQAAKELAYEEAARLRDRIKKLRLLEMELS